MLGKPMTLGTPTGPRAETAAVFLRRSSPPGSGARNALAPLLIFFLRPCRPLDSPASQETRPAPCWVLFLSPFPILFLALFLVRPLGAQELFHLGAWTGYAEISLRLQEQESSSLLGPRALFERELTEQRLVLRNSMTIVDRKFLTVNYGLNLGFLQSHLATQDQEGEGDGELRAFDVTATFRPVSSYPVTVLFNRSEDEIPVEFAGLRQLQSESLSFTLGLGPAQLPGALTLRQSELESSSEFGSSIQSIDQRRRLLNYSAANRWPRHQLNLSYQAEDVEDRIAQRFSNLAHTATISHTFEILAPKLATLRSLVRYFDRSGQLDASSYYLDETMRLQHRRNFSSNLRYVAQRLETFSGPAANSQRALLGFHHQLFESLETDFRLGRNRLTSAGRRLNLDEAALDSTYRKNLWRKGKLTGRFNSRYELRDSRQEDGQELITEERLTGRFGIPARLERPSVLVETVVVTDESRTTIFQEGVDYELLLVGDFAEITPLPGGLIQDGQVLLVEYRVTAPGRGRSTAVSTGLELALDYGWFSPFWGYRRLDHERSEGHLDRLLDDQHEQFMGLRLRHQGRALHLLSFTELRTLDSQLQAFRTLRTGGSFTYRPRAAWSLRLNLAYVATDFSIPQRETRTSDGRIGLRWRPHPYFDLEAYGSARRTRDTLAADQAFQRFGFRGRLLWGKISLVAAVEQWRRDRTLDEIKIEEFQGMTASLKISRRFFPGRLGTPVRLAAPEPWPENLPGLWSVPDEQEESNEETNGEAQENGDERAATGAGRTLTSAPTDPGTAPAVESEAELAATLAEASSASETAPELAPLDPLPAPAAADREMTRDIPAEVSQSVEAWARAWEQQSVEAYLSFYGESFRPQGLTDRGEWEMLRRRRLRAPGTIRVKISDLGVEATEPGRARARFVQTYRSDLHTDVVEKTLEWSLENGEWRISREQAQG